VGGGGFGVEVTEVDASAIDEYSCAPFLFSFEFGDADVA